MKLPIFPVLFCLAPVAGDELGGVGGVSLPCSVPGPRCDGDPGGRKKLMQPTMDRSWFIPVVIHSQPTTWGVYRGIDIVHSDYTFCARTLSPLALLMEGEGWASLKTCKRLRAPASQAEFEQSFSAIFCIKSCHILFQSERGVLKVSWPEFFTLCYHALLRYLQVKCTSAMNDPYCVLQFCTSCGIDKRTKECFV